MRGWRSIDQGLRVCVMWTGDLAYGCILHGESRGAGEGGVGALHSLEAQYLLFFLYQIVLGGRGRIAK